MAAARMISGSQLRLRLPRATSRWLSGRMRSSPRDGASRSRGALRIRTSPASSRSRRSRRFSRWPLRLTASSCRPWRRSRCASAGVRPTSGESAVTTPSATTLSASASSFSATSSPARRSRARATTRSRSSGSPLSSRTSSALRIASGRGVWRRKRSRMMVVTRRLPSASASSSATVRPTKGESSGTRASVEYSSMLKAASMDRLAARRSGSRR